MGSAGEVEIVLRLICRVNFHSFSMGSESSEFMCFIKLLSYFSCFCKGWILVQMVGGLVVHFG